MLDIRCESDLTALICTDLLAFGVGNCWLPLRFGVRVILGHSQEQLRPELKKRTRHIAELLAGSNACH